MATTFAILGAIGLVLALAVVRKMRSGANIPPEVSGSVILGRMLRNAEIENLPEAAIEEIVRDVVARTQLQSTSARMSGPWRGVFISLLAAETESIAALVAADNFTASRSSRTYEILRRYRVI